MDPTVVVIDFQERLAPHVVDIDYIAKNLVKLIKFCKLMDIPVVVTEQIKLGSTVKELRDVLGEFEPIRKISFSCCKNEEFFKVLGELKRREIVLTGLETHICVLQTALDLLKLGYEVYLAVDCTGSRKKLDRDVAIQRMAFEGVKLTTAETFIYEQTVSADMELFKEILDIVKE